MNHQTDHAADRFAALHRTVEQAASEGHGQFSRYQISASKGGTMATHIESPIFDGHHAEAQARNWAAQNTQGYRCVNLLKEDQHPINAGKFFLHLILKSH